MLKPTKKEKKKSSDGVEAGVGEWAVGGGGAKFARGGGGGSRHSKTICRQVSRKDALG